MKRTNKNSSKFAPGKSLRRGTNNRRRSGRTKVILLDKSRVKPFNEHLDAYLKDKLQNYPKALQRNQLAGVSKAIKKAIDDALNAAQDNNWHRQLHNTKKRKAQEEICPSKAITYSSFFKETVLPELLKYFAVEQHPLLRDLIVNGNAPDKPLQFLGRANQLVELFKRAKYNRHVVCYSNTPLQEWICKFFTYQTKEGFASFNPPSVAEILKNADKEGVSKNHILLAILPCKIIPELRK